MLSKKCLLNETFSLTGGGICGIFYLSGFLNETRQRVAVGDALRIKEKLSEKLDNGKI